MSKDYFRLVFVLSVLVLSVGLFQGVAVAGENAVEHVVREYYMPHIAADGAIWNTYLLTDNLTNMPAVFTVTVYDEQGTVLGAYDRTVAGFGSDVMDFHVDSPSGTVCATIETEARGMSFRVAYHSSEGGVTEYPAPSSSSPILAFNFGAYYGNIQWKGFSVWNDSTQAQDVKFYGVDAAGNVMGEFQKSIPSNARIAYMLDSPETFGAAFDWRNCSRVVASGSGYLAGVNMSGEGLDRLLLSPAVPAPMAPESALPTPAYQVIAWNDLGMHCYDSDFSIFSILPPYNSLWAQVIRTGPNPELVSSGVTVSYRFENNTYSAGKTNF